MIARVLLDVAVQQPKQPEDQVEIDIVGVPAPQRAWLAFCDVAMEREFQLAMPNSNNASARRRKLCLITLACFIAPQSASMLVKPFFRNAVLSQPAHQQIVAVLTGMMTVSLVLSGIITWAAVRLRNARKYLDIFNMSSWLVFTVYMICAALFWTWRLRVMHPSEGDQQAEWHTAQGFSAASFLCTSGFLFCCLVHSVLYFLIFRPLFSHAAWFVLMQIVTVSVFAHHAAVTVSVFAQNGAVSSRVFTQPGNLIFIYLHLGALLFSLMSVHANEAAQRQLFLRGRALQRAVDAEHSTEQRGLGDGVNEVLGGEGQGAEGREAGFGLGREREQGGRGVPMCCQRSEKLESVKLEALEEELERANVQRQELALLLSQSLGRSLLLPHAHSREGKSPPLVPCQVWPVLRAIDCRALCQSVQSGNWTRAHQRGLHRALQRGLADGPHGTGPGAANCHQGSQGIPMSQGSGGQSVLVYGDPALWKQALVAVVGSAFASGGPESAVTLHVEVQGDGVRVSAVVRSVEAEEQEVEVEADRGSIGSPPAASAPVSAAALVAALGGGSCGAGHGGGAGGRGGGSTGGNAAASEGKQEGGGSGAAAPPDDASPPIGPVRRGADFAVAEQLVRALGGVLQAGPLGAEHSKEALHVHGPAGGTDGRPPRAAAAPAALATPGPVNPPSRTAGAGASVCFSFCAAGCRSPPSAAAVFAAGPSGDGRHLCEGEGSGSDAYGTAEDEAEDWGGSGGGGVGEGRSVTCKKQTRASVPPPPLPAAPGGPSGGAGAGGAGGAGVAGVAGATEAWRHARGYDPTTAHQRVPRVRTRTRARHSPRARAAPRLRYGCGGTGETADMTDYGTDSDPDELAGFGYGCGGMRGGLLRQHGAAAVRRGAATALLDDLLG
jgi:hypothetical protein